LTGHRCVGKVGRVKYLIRTGWLVLADGATLRCYSARPDVRLRVTMGTPHHAVNIRPHPESDTVKPSHYSARNDPGREDRFAWFDKLPQGVDIYFAKGVGVNGVEFDYLRPGGLLLVDAADRARWGNVAFGAHCAKERETVVPALGKGAGY
jgi:hypothetical protein